jgi:hypothetical protein
VDSLILPRSRRFPEPFPLTGHIRLNEELLRSNHMYSKEGNEVKVSRVGSIVIVGTLIGLLLWGSALAYGKQPIRVVFSTNEDYDISMYGTDEGLKEIEEDFQLIRELGVSRLRVSFSWSNYETAQGEFVNLEWLHRFVDLADEYDITLMPYLCYAPMWAAVYGHWSDPPEDYQYWYDYVYRMVSEFKDQIHYWEIWNEEDMDMWFSGSVKQYAKLLEMGAKAVRDANPEVTVIMGGLTWPNSAWLEQVLDQVEPDTFDVLPIHSYAESWSSSSVESYLTSRGSDFDSIASVLHEKGTGQPIWLNEIGYPTIGAKTEVDQARFIRRAVATLMATERISLISWYEIKDLRQDTHLGVIGDSNNYYLGITYPDRTKKLGFYTLQDMVRELNDTPLTHIESGIGFTELEPDETEPIVYLHGFRRETDGKVFLFAWLYGPDDEIEVNLELTGDVKEAIEHQLDGTLQAVERTRGNEILAVKLVRNDARLFEITLTD